MLKIFATFLKKGSAKNFPTGKILGYFSKIVRSTVIGSTPSGFVETIFILQTPSLAVGTADHLIRHLTVTPSPTGEGNREALFRQQIYNETIDGRMGYISLLLREKGDRVSGG